MRSTDPGSLWVTIEEPFEMVIERPELGDDGKPLPLPRGITSYEEWNGYITKLESDFKAGASLAFKADPHASDPHCWMILCRIETRHTEKDGRWTPIVFRHTDGKLFYGSPSAFIVVNSQPYGDFSFKAKRFMEDQTWKNIG